MDEYTQTIINTINEERKNRGLSPLKIDPRLCKSAYNQNLSMMNDTDINDFSPPRGFIGYIRNQTGGDYNNFGQIVTMGAKVEKIINNIKKGSGKMSFIYSPQYSHLGIGICDMQPRVKLITLHFCG